MGKVTLKSKLETYKISNTQRDRFNKIYPHLAYELMNVYGSKTSFSSDIFPLAYMLQHSSPILQMLTSKMLVRDPKKSGNFICLEAVVQSCPVKKVFLEISQNSQENTCARFSSVS